MDEVTMDLIGVTSLGVSDSVRDYLWLIISLLHVKSHLEGGE